MYARALTYAWVVVIDREIIDVNSSLEETCSDGKLSVIGMDVHYLSLSAIVSVIWLNPYSVTVSYLTIDCIGLGGIG